MIISLWRNLRGRISENLLTSNRSPCCSRCQVAWQLKRSVKNWKPLKGYLSGCNRKPNLMAHNLWQQLGKQFLIYQTEPFSSSLSAMSKRSFLRKPRIVFSEFIKFNNLLIFGEWSVARPPKKANPLRIRNDGKKSFSLCAHPKVHTTKQVRKQNRLIIQQLYCDAVSVRVCHTHCEEVHASRLYTVHAASMPRGSMAID